MKNIIVLIDPEQFENVKNALSILQGKIYSLSLWELKIDEQEINTALNVIDYQLSGLDYINRQSEISKNTIIFYHN